ncbi:ABC transporter permease [Stygiolobus caldivivus]|uniref:ABC transporter permease n=1 Tax=Stygiolobus caldivivus TaxID=2824673 RepID=UPI001C85EF76|nr:ABC transporter permease [Stygiolobus caldivivus]
MRHLKIKFILAFARFYGYAPLTRGAVYVFSYLTVPLAELFLIYIITKGAFVKFAIAGGLITVIATNGLSFIADFAFLRLELKLQDLLVATEISAGDYILALTVSNLIYSSPGIITYLVLAFIYHLLNITNFVPALFVLLLLLLNTSALGFFIGSLIPHVRYSWGIGSIMGTLLTILPPVFYPYYLLPNTIFETVYPLPTTLASLLIQNLTGLISTKLVVQSLILLVIETALFYYLSIKFSRWVSK